MKDIFLKFLETQDLTTIMTEAAVLFTAWQGWKKWKAENKTETKKKFLKALKGTEIIDDLLSELQTDFKCTTDGDNGCVIPAVVEITNGGGIPQADKPLYLRVLNSTNHEVLSLWGDKSLMVPSMNKAIMRLVQNGLSSLEMERFELKKVESWSGAKGIQKVHYFVIGWKQKSLTILAINTDTKEELTNEQVLIGYDYAERIKDAFNESKRIWDSKMK